MDTTGKYIKMCEQAQEIQRLKDLTDKKSFFGEGKNELISKNVAASYYTNKSIWLPRQDQLQEIHPIGLVMGILGDSWSDEMGFDKEDELLEKYLSSFKTNEQIHLAFIMKNYNKIWNEEQQDWIQL